MTNEIIEEEIEEGSVDSDGIPNRQTAEEKVHTITHMLAQIKDGKDPSKKELKRRLQNRRSAILSRLRKQKLINTLKGEETNLKTENENLVVVRQCLQAQLAKEKQNSQALAAENEALKLRVQELEAKLAIQESGVEGPLVKCPVLTEAKTANSSGIAQQKIYDSMIKKCPIV